MVCVAPSVRASAKRCSCTSTAMMGSQPAILADIRPDRPTAPTPNTTKLSSARGFITMRTAPAPGRPAQDSAPLSHVENHPSTVLPAAGERANVLDRGIVADFHRIAFVGDGEISKRRLLEKGAVDRLPPPLSLGECLCV